MGETDGIRVRAACRDDVPALLVLLNEIVRAGGTTAIEEALDEATFRDWFTDGASGVACLVATDAGGTPLGFQSLSRRADLPEGCVDIATFARRRPKVRGVGTALFARMRGLARERGIASINATIRADNVGGLAYYERMGFVDHAREEGVPLRDGRAVDRVSKRYAVVHHDHDHDHDPLERGAALRTRALEELLVAKGLVDPAALDAIVEYYERETGPRNGAKVVARAWTDPDFRARLLEDGAAAIGSLGFGGFEGECLRVVENDERVHNVVVCTLCSCYPWPVLGLPPAWYKSEAYRSRVVREPRAVLAEFGLDISPDVTIRVWDSTAEVRYLVVPRRPPGTDDLDEAALAALVTRDGMIGTAAL